jgi:hypothetical protein
MKDRWGVAIVAVLGLVGLTVLLPWVLEKVVETASTQDLYIPVLAIVSVLTLLIALALMTLSAAALDLSDRTQALGLPDGSIRAVIALGLIVLFAVISIFLYTSISNPQPLAKVPGLSAEQVTFLKKQVPGEVITVPRANENTVDAYYHDSRSVAGDDFAKQLLVLLGTLVTSVSSFYFGSKVAAGSNVPATLGKASPPKLRNVSPTTLPRDVLVSLTISGDNLDLIKEAKLVQGERQIVCTDLTSNASVVKCNVSVPAALPAGAWDLIVNDGAGRQATLAGAISVS